MFANEINAFWAFSERVDALFFPVPDGRSNTIKALQDLDRRQDAAIRKISACIATCKTIAQTYAAMDMIQNSIRLYGNTGKIANAAKVLHGDIFKRQAQILDTL